LSHPIIESLHLTAKEPDAEKEMTDSIRKDANRPYFEREVVDSPILQ
jgi:hypothetical protein